MQQTLGAMAEDNSTGDILDVNHDSADPLGNCGEDANEAFATLLV